MLKYIILLCFLFINPSHAQQKTPAVNSSMVTTIGSLATCNAAAQGTRMVVTDALTPVALATVVAGGSVVVSVMCNGTVWIVG